MTGLLVSVRCAEEARIALAGGADIIDVKEPSRGPLGYADPKVWQAILDVVGGQAIASVVLGELLTDPVEHLAPQTAGFAFAKIGLAGCAAHADWPKRWNLSLRGLAPGVKAVPVAYADWKKAQSPPPGEVLKLAAATSRLVVIDTFDKAAGTLLEAMAWVELEDVVQAARLAVVRVTLAGSLCESAIARVLRLGPAYVGIRTAACLNGRESVIDLQRVKKLASIVRSSPEAGASR